MLRALLIWLCFTEILKKTGSSSRSAWSPWHFSENLDQLGTWYIYIYTWYQFEAYSQTSFSWNRIKKVIKSNQSCSCEMNMMVRHTPGPTPTFLKTMMHFFPRMSHVFFSSWFESTHFAGHLQYVHPMITVPFLSTTPEVTGASWCKGAEVPREWWKIHLLVHFWW